MRKLCLLLFVFGSLQSTLAQTPAKPKDLEPLNWLLGTWNRLDTKPGRSGLEAWEKISDQQFNGLGISLRGVDTAFKEKIQIIIKDGAVYYVADVPGNAQPVYFKFTAWNATGFTCENPDHDFPRKIVYQLEGNILHASISGNGKTVPYRFEKK